MDFLHQPERLLREKGAIHTAREIYCQPVLWHQTFDLFFSVDKEMQFFLDTALKETTCIILAGAGTSSFIGNSLQGSFFRTMKLPVFSIATTDIVSNPQNYLSQFQIPLIISFARSGNSPESIAALALADQFSKKCFHLIITCDAKGSLAEFHTANPKQVFVLPEDANDKSLAMTGSYTSMLLTGLLIAFIKQLEFCKTQMEILYRYAEKILSTELDTLQHIAEKEFQRAVFLGSGNLYGTAKESALKLQELTDGQVICKADTYLGFRHGPKSIINEHTLVVYIFSNNPHVERYEKDLLFSMKQGNTAMYELGIGEHRVNADGLHKQIIFSSGNNIIAEDFLPVCSVLPAQLLAFYKSVQLGLMPDAPSESGSISRVVQGVNIYPVVV
jgi:tagatose-6-phosphate ketose/aldose isomerase